MINHFLTQDAPSLWHVFESKDPEGVRREWDCLVSGGHRVCDSQMV